MVIMTLGNLGLVSMDGGRGRGRGRGRPQIPAPSSLKEKEVNVHFPFMVTRVPEKDDKADKFCRRMDEGCVRAFAVFGPLRCLHAAFSSFQATHKESKYRGMFQQISPCLAHISGLRTRIQDLTVPVVVPQSRLIAAGVIDDDRASGDSAFLYRIDAEYSGGQGRADYVVRTIPKRNLERFKACHKEINWNNSDKEELAVRVFAAIPDEDVRCDAVLDLKTDSVTEWLVKTRAQLSSYGNQLALQNMNKGFAPRPIYLIAIDSMSWRACIIDPVGVIKVDDRKIAGFADFHTQQTLRSNWLQKKDPQGEGYFATADAWTMEMLQQRLDHLNALIVRKENTSGVAGGNHVVSNLWENMRVEQWNGRGLLGALQQGTLTLCEGLLRITCGDKVCNQRWTPQRLRMVFGLQHEREINRCLEFEKRAISGAVSHSRRSFTCTYSREVILAAFSAIRNSELKPSATFRKGFTDSIARAKEYLSTVARSTTTSAALLKVGSVYGGHEFLEFVDILTTNRVDIPSCHIVVDDDIAEEDSMESFRAVVICTRHMPKVRLKDCKVLVCYAVKFHPCVWHELFQEDYARLVVFAKNVDDEALDMLNKLEAEVNIVTVTDEASLDALATYLSIQVVDVFESNLGNCFGNAKKILRCRDKVIVYRPDEMETTQRLSNVVELRVSGATHDHFKERIECVLTAVNAMNSALAKGVIPGDGIGLREAGENLTDSADAEYNAGVRIVKQALKIIDALSPSLGSSLVARLLGSSEIFNLSQGGHQFIDMFEEGIIDLEEAAEQTLDKVLGLYDRAVSLGLLSNGNNKKRPSEIELVPEQKKLRES